MNEEKYTFWKLINEFSIEIPIIQRDYVQGRENEKKVRENFLNAIYNSLKNEKGLHLDFVYGVLKNDKFIPLDGQQRLTTLFLIHYYLSLKENRFEEFQNHLKKDNVIKFSYETRESSKEFCKQILENEIELNDKKISEIIKNENWFYSKWKQDPTIYSMLIMLDEIQKIFKKDNLFEELINGKITFSFLEPKKLNIKNPNELYIKMNSRGKPLNEFENFKSYLMQFLNEEEKIKFDNEWFDIFWNLNNQNLKKENLKEKNIQKNEEIIEDKIFGSYLNFFKNITAFYSDDFNEVDIFKFKYSKQNIEEIVKILDYLQDYNDEIIYELRNYEDFKINIFQDFIEIEASKPEYSKRLRFYALMQFFLKVEKIDEKLLLQWMRVSLNLINNASPYSKKDDFIKLKENLNKLSEELLNSSEEFYKKLSELNIDNLPKDIEKQFEEEKLKAELICQNYDYENEFIKAEKNWYLDGQIGFLIEFAGGKDNKDKFNIEEFKKYRDAFNNLWKFAKEKKENEMLIQRALLTFGDSDKGYLAQYNQTDKYTFGSFGLGVQEKNENWRLIFKKKSEFKDLSA
jgi:hypothetical protein